MNEKTFYDGILYIIECKCTEGKVTVVTLDGEYDEPITLSDIAEKYPDVRKVIFEEPLRGYVFDYGNHGKGKWEQVGTTKGYA